MKRTAAALAMISAMTLPVNSHPAEETPAQRMQTFISEMVEKHDFDRQQLDTLFAGVKLQPKIIQTISSPAEAKPWHAYRKIFLTESRIQGGVEFWHKHADMLQQVADRFGVPEHIIIAILGVETRYGGHTGNHKVIQALSTLAFDYPKRSKFFRSELENFLILARDEGMPPETLTGSYAGAMGMPQFMPSSFRHYAADFDGDSKHDIWNNVGDTAASIANYFSRHGWHTGEPVAYAVSVTGQEYKPLLEGGLKPEETVATIGSKGVTLPPGANRDHKAKLLELEGDNGPEHWLAMHNFYVITRYNHSPLYGMAVHQLSREILARHQQSLRAGTE